MKFLQLLQEEKLRHRCPRQSKNSCIDSNKKTNVKNATRVSAFEDINLNNVSLPERYENINSLELESYQIKDKVGSPLPMFYFSSFVSEHLEQVIIENLENLNCGGDGSGASGWKQLKTRKVQTFVTGMNENESDVPPFVKKLFSCIEKFLRMLNLDVEVRLNHLLVNKYEAGQGIMPHTDGTFQLVV